MNSERLEMELKSIIVQNCKEIKKEDLSYKRIEKSFGKDFFKPSTFIFNEMQFDIMTLQLIDYINQNHGDGKFKRNK